nr:zinc finger, CCHC-type [Tanacetum cinerariifolium]
MLDGLGEVNPTHAYYNSFRTSKDNEDPSWSNNNVGGPLMVIIVEHNNFTRNNDNRGKRTNGSVSGSNKTLKGQNMFNKSLQVYYVTYVSESHFVQDDDVAWWVESGEIVHVCKDRCWFKTYESLNDGSILHIGNESTALVHGRGCVDLRFSFGKIVSLFDVLLNIVNNNIAPAFMSTSKLNDSILWHARQGHIHFKRMQDKSKDGLIPSFEMDTKKWNKKQFVTFIDDDSRFCCVYLLHTKDKALDKFKVFKLKLNYNKGSLIKRFKTDREGDEVSDQYSYCFNVEDDPNTFDEAMKSQDVAFWKKAINDEMDFIMGNNTWVLANLPPGFRQKSGIDYFDTYASVARINTIRLLIALASIHNLIIYQMDMKTRLLNGKLDE